MIAKRSHRGWWDGRNRVRPNQGFDVQDIGIRRILGSCASPQRPLQARAASFQSREGLAVENLTEATVDAFGIRDSHRSPESQRLRQTDRVELPIRDQIEAADEYRGDRHDPARIRVPV